MENEIRKDIDRIKNFNNIITENIDNDFEKINKLKQIYDGLIQNYVSQSKAAEELMRQSTGGYEIGEYGYPIVFFAGEYCLVLGSGVYKRIR